MRPPIPNLDPKLQTLMEIQPRNILKGMRRTLKVRGSDIPRSLLCDQKGRKIPRLLQRELLRDTGPHIWNRNQVEALPWALDTLLGTELLVACTSRKFGMVALEEMRLPALPHHRLRLSDECSRNNMITNMALVDLLGCPHNHQELVCQGIADLQILPDRWRVTRTLPNQVMVRTLRNTILLNGSTRIPFPQILVMLITGVTDIHIPATTNTNNGLWEDSIH
jgi:hypothetical protein